ncbi:hypothetical protein D9758_009546 [Tetrapyrgos nigripes]|uniref:F-box domain-containing protein n=1 Tax=Tetrapyrgos nigripes TaxID=182062 RepID=A0A8H5LE64_9AGAR|nr:hypothetical protein D9758_009546 [Tetrapyrgos nigripes]
MSSSSSSLPDSDSPAKYAKKEQQQHKNVPARQYVSTTLCHQCGHALKLKLRVRAVDNVEKIRSGHVPQSSEYAMICQLIKEGDEDIERYRRELHNLRSTTAKIERDKQALETYLLDLRCMVSPIRRVPTEVMTEIMRQVCCTVNDAASAWLSVLLVGNDLCSTRISDIPTLALASVCSTWRKIIQSTPSLWSHIILSYNQRTTPPQLLDLFLTRSNPVALHFHLEDASAMQTRWYPYETDTNLHKLLQHASRWGSVSLGPIYHPFVESEILQQLTYTDLPHLIRLDIANDPDAHLYVDDSPFLVEERISPLPLRVPNLRSMSIDFFGLAINSSVRSLRSLELTNSEPRRVMLTLAQLPNLTDLSLCCCQVQDPLKDTPKVVVRNLRNLFIEWDSFFGPLEGDIHPYEKVLEALTLPALESLTLGDAVNLHHYDDDNGNEENESGFDVDPLMEMLERSHNHGRTGTATGMKLKRLGLWMIDMTGEQLLKLLRLECMNELTHLRVKESSCSDTETVTGEVVEALTLATGRGSGSEALASESRAGAGGDDNGTRNPNPNPNSAMADPAFQSQPSTTTTTSMTTSSTRTLPANATALLPRLTHLDLVVYPRFSSEDFLGMVMSRTRGSAKSWASPGSGSGSGSSNVVVAAATGTGTSASSDPTSGSLGSCNLAPGFSVSFHLPLGFPCLKKLRLTRLTGALYDNLRRDLEELGKEGLQVFFDDLQPHPGLSWEDSES